VPAVASTIATIVAQVFPIVLHVASIVLEILPVRLQLFRVLSDTRVAGFLVGLEVGFVARDVARIRILVDAVGSNVPSIVANVAEILPPVALRDQRSTEPHQGRCRDPHCRTPHNETLLLAEFGFRLEPWERFRVIRPAGLLNVRNKSSAAETTYESRCGDCASERGSLSVSGNACLLLQLG
jgi:hypothetical protein